MVAKQAVVLKARRVDAKDATRDVAARIVEGARVDGARKQRRVQHVLTPPVELRVVEVVRTLLTDRAAVRPQREPVDTMALRLE